MNTPGCVDGNSKILLHDVQNSAFGLIILKIGLYEKCYSVFFFWNFIEYYLSSSTT